MSWVLVGIIVTCNACGDLLNAAGMRRHGVVRDLSPKAAGSLVLALLRNPYVLGGLLTMALAFFSFMSLLSIANLSFAVPATAASYLVETVLARYILKERVGWRRWAGASLVAFGVALLAL